MIGIFSESAALKNEQPKTVLIPPKHYFHRLNALVETGGAFYMLQACMEDNFS